MGSKPGSDAQFRASRAGIVLTYAHLEGFARQAIRSYFAYVKSRALKYSELGPNFLALKLATLASQGTSKASYYGGAVEILTTGLREVAELPEVDIISAHSSLSYARLVEMLYCVNLSPTVLATKQHFMDEILLDRRNAIAHGEFRRPALADYVEVHLEVVEMLDTLETFLVHSAGTQAYLR